MNNLPRNVIMDLLPVYITGDASQETKSLIEEYAKTDLQIARIIAAGDLPDITNSEKINSSELLEKKTISRMQRNIKRKLGYVASGTALLLMIPFIAMQFNTGVNWSIFDFLVMGTLISVTGFLYVFISGLSDNWLFRVATGIAILTGFLLIWVNLAVGFIGSENNPVNLLYLGVLAVGLAGTGISKFKSSGMSNALFVTAFAQMIVPVVALLISPATLNEPPGVTGIFLLNGFFAGMFALSGFLFRLCQK